MEGLMLKKEPSSFKIVGSRAQIKFWRPLEVGSLPFQILRLTDFQARDPNFVLALELRVCKLEGSSYDIRPSIYVLKGWYYETPKKVAVTVILGAKAFLPPRVE